MRFNSAASWVIVWTSMRAPPWAVRSTKKQEGGPVTPLLFPEVMARATAQTRRPDITTITLGIQELLSFFWEGATVINKF